MVASRGRLDSTSPCLVLAPHLHYPLRNGSDILIDRKWSQFSKYVPFVDIIGRDTIKRYENGRVTTSAQFVNARKTQPRAAVNTIVKGSHYMREKVVTRNFSRIARSYYLNPEYKMVVFSFIWTAAVADGLPRLEDRLVCVETHNDELRWFENLRKHSVNPLAKLAAYYSNKWLLSFLRKHESEYLFLHVSETDQKGYLKYFPDHKSWVVPVGVEEVADGFSQQEKITKFDKARLIFVGSLGVKINLDALNVLKTEFYPLLKERLGEDIEVLIVGSNPSREVAKLCKEAGWKLHRNVSDRKLRYLYSISTCSMLPFRYTTGSKLKLLESLANGVPYLATLELRDQLEEVVYPCLVSDDPAEWLHRVREIKKKGITIDERIELRDYAKKHSWASVARDMFHLLNQDQEVQGD